jgi:hypothetical protein
MARYKIWDKKEFMVCPNGAIFTAEQWIAENPAAGVLKTVCADSEVNGAIFGVFSVMVENARKAGCDFSACETDQDYLDAIEAFEDEMNAPSNEVSAEERIAAALEYQVMASLDDVEE